MIYQRSFIYEPRSGDKNDLTIPQPCEISGHMVLAVSFPEWDTQNFFLSLFFFLPRYLIIKFPSQITIACTITPISHSF